MAYPIRRPIHHLRAVLLASTIAIAAIAPAYAQDMPSGGVVSAGAATIANSGATTTIRQGSDRAVIDWQRFSIGAGGQVVIEQPKSNSALLNRVSGSEMSRIAGNLTANGQVFLINTNGIIVDRTGTVQARGGFVASTLDIDNADFMAGKLNFRGGGTGAVANRGYIAGGAVALLGSQVANDGVIVSPLGRVAIGAAKQATLDLNGDGLLQVAIPSDFVGADGTAFISNTGLIDAAGGTVMLKVATAREIVRQTINMAGIIRATSASRSGGTVLLDGGDGAVGIAGTIDASGLSGGRIDVTGGDVSLTGATLAAKGAQSGGLIRVGGSFQGGAPSPATDAALAGAFTTRFGPLTMLNAAHTTTIDAVSTLDVSGGAAGGAAVVWSAEQTRQSGIINAAGPTGGGIEISSKGTLTTNLSRVTAGVGGTLLLDPKNINVYNAYAFGSGTTADPLSATIGYGAASGTDATFNVADIKALMDGGTNVFLRASNDINWSADLNVAFAAATPGNLSLSAGRSVTIGGYLTLNQANLTVIANDTLAHGVIDADRDAGAGGIDALNAQITGAIGSGGTGGNVSLTIGSGAGVTNALAGGMRLAPIDARSIAIDAGVGTVSLFADGGGTDPALFRAAEALTITGAIKVQASGGLTLSGHTVDWLNETSAVLSSDSPSTVIRFIENGTLTRYGVLNGVVGNESEGGPAVDTTRLALGKGGAGAAYSAVYGTAYGTFDALHIVSGTLQGSDTLAGILTAGATTTTGPATGQGVGDYAVTTSATSGFGLASGVSGYFVDLRTANDTLRITPKTLTATVNAGAYTYGSPISVATLTGLVGSDSVGLAATVTGLGTQGLNGNPGGYAFAANLAAGQRSFTLTGLTGAAAANYTLDLSGTISAALTITPKTLTYAGSSTTSTYGTLNTAAFTLSGILFGDDVSIGLAGISRNGTTTALTATTGVGTYATVASALTGSAAGNYAIEAANSSAGSAIITPKALTYVTANSSATYGTLATIATPTLTGVIAGDAVGAIAALNNGTQTLDARTAAGSYSINAALTGAGADNYVVSSVGNSIGTLTIGRLAVGVTVADATQVYFSPVALATLNGVLAGDDVSPDGLLDNSRSNAVAVSGGLGFDRPDVGTHSFQLVGLTGSAAGNYVLDPSAPRTATLTVTPKPLRYSIDSITSTYGATFNTPMANLIDLPFFPLTASILVTNVTTGASVPLADIGRLGAGRYMLTAGALSGTDAFNYMIATSGNTQGTLLITPKAISYSASSVSGTYGDLLSAPFAVLNGAYSSDDVSANISVLSGTSAIALTNRTAAGTYTVTVTGLGGAAASNYILTGGTDGLVTISQRSVSYILGTAATTYGQLATPTATLFGVLAGDTVTPTFFVNGGELTNRLNVGTYTVYLGGFGGAQGSNYAVSTTGNNMNADIYIHPAPLTYTMASSTSVYGDPLNFAPIVWSGMQLGESAPASVAQLNDSKFYTYVNAGTYTPDVIANIGSNYYLASSSAGAYTITRRPIALESVPVTTYGTTYGLKADQIGGALTASNVVDGSIIKLSVTPQNVTTSTGGYVNAGSYTLKIGASVGDGYGTNYSIGSITEGMFTVTPAVLVMRDLAQVASTYGTAATLTAGTADTLQGDVVNFTGLGLAQNETPIALAAQTSVGTYNVRASGLVGADAGNYIFNLAHDVGVLRIAPKALTYNTGNLTATYGTLAALGTATLTGIVGADQVVGLNTVLGGYYDRSAAGLYKFDAPVLTGAAAANYTLARFDNINGLLSIAPRALSVTYLASAPTSWVYGTTQDPTQFFQLNGILNGDTVGATGYAVLTGTAAGNPLFTGTYYALGDQLNAGTYRISATGSSGVGVLTGASAGNYVLRQGASTNSATSVTVTPRVLSGTLTLPATAVYGDAPAITVGFTNQVGTAPIDYAVTATLTGTSRDLGRATALPANLAVGTQRLGVSLAGLDAFNYSLGAPVTGQIAITPKTVSIDTLTGSVTYALATGAVYAINGMVAGDDVAPVVSFAGNAAARATTLADGFGLPLITNDVGTYATSIGSLAGTAASNYVLTPYTGSLTVTPKTITYTSQGFAAQYGGLTLPVCNSGCEMSGKDNLLQMGAVTLNGILPSDSGLIRGVPLLTLQGAGSAFSYARNTAAGNYLQIVSSLEGSKTNDYVLANDGNTAGAVFILPAWVKASVTGGGRLYTDIKNGKYVSLGTPGIVTIHRSDYLTDAQGGNAFLPNDGVNVVVQLVDAKGNIVDPASTLPVGSYTLDPLVLSGPQAANYRLVPESANGSKAGVFTVSDSSVFNFTFESGLPSGTYVAPAVVAKPAITPTTSTISAIDTSNVTSITQTSATGASAGAGGSTSSTQQYADGSSMTTTGSGEVTATASYGPTSATVTGSASANVSLILNRGPVTIDYGAFAEASGKVEVSLKDLTVTAGGEALTGVSEALSVGGNLGSGMSGSTGITAKAFGTANGEGTASLKDGATLKASSFVGVGASIGADGSLTGGGVTASLAATLYSPGSLYIGAALETGYADHTLTIGFNFGISLLIGGLEISPKISFSTEQFEEFGQSAIKGYTEIFEKIAGVYCDNACTAARAKAEADYQTELTKFNLDQKVDIATTSLMTGNQPTAQMIAYLQANPDVVRYAQDSNTTGARIINQAVADYESLASMLQQTVSKEQALTARLANDPQSLTADDLAEANQLRAQEKAIVDGVKQKFGMRVVVQNGQLTFGP